MNTAAVDDIDEDFTGRCYTKARRAPLVHGIVRGINGGRNFRLPFGPYTLTQLASIIVSAGVLILSRPLWGGHGPADAMVLLAVPLGAAFALRHLHIDGRNPAAAGASVALMLISPCWGRIHGRPLRPARARREAPRVTLDDPSGSDGASPAPTPALKRSPRRPQPIPAPEGPEAPAIVLAAAMPMASGVQALLARRPQP